LLLTELLFLLYLHTSMPERGPQELSQESLDIESYRPLASLLHTLWNNPAAVIETHKRILKESGISLVERLAYCPVPVRLHYPISLSPEQLEKIGLSNNREFQITVSKESIFTMYVYGDRTTGEQHVAMIKDIKDGKDVPIRIHSSCLTAESFHASNCDCHEQLEMAMNIAEKEGFGGVIWLHQEGRGNGLVAKAKQLKMMMHDEMNTVEAFQALGYPSEIRDFTPAAEIIRDLGIQSIRLITNNPDKISQMQDAGIDVKDIISCYIVPFNGILRKDLIAKRKHHNHLLPDDM